MHSTLYLCAASGAPTGSAILTVVGSDGTTTQTAPITLNIQ